MPSVANRLIKIVGLVTVCLMAVASCSSPAPTDTTPRIIVTTNVLGAVVSQLVDGEAAVTILDQPGQDPHAAEAPHLEVPEAPVLAVVMNGAGLDDRWDEYVEKLSPAVPEPFVAMDSVPGALDLVFTAEADGAIGVETAPAVESGEATVATPPPSVTAAPTTTAPNGPSSTVVGSDGAGFGVESAGQPSTTVPPTLPGATTTLDAGEASRSTDVTSLTTMHVEPSTSTTTSVRSGGEGAPIPSVLDPHFWVDPQKMAAVVPTLARFLGEALPEQRDAIATRGAELVAALVAESADWEQRFAVIPPSRRNLITDHPSLGYLSAYDLKTAGVLSVGLGGEQAARQADAVSMLMAGQELCTILLTDPEQRSAAERVATAVGSNVIVQEVGIRQPQGDLLDFYRLIADSIVAGLTTCGSAKVEE